MKKNDSIELTIDDLGTAGQGIGRHEGMAVFLPGALPGETALCKIITIKKTFAVGKLEQVLHPSPMRVKPPCRVFSRCGGCTLQHLSYPAQLEYKQKHVSDCIRRISKLDIPVLFPLPSLHEYRYRNKAAFPVRMQDGQVEIGFYAAHSHNVVDIDDCKIQHGDIALVMSQLRVWIAKHDISIYDEQTGEGLLRHIVLRTNRDGDIMLILVINGTEIPHQSDLLLLFKFVLPQLKSIILNTNTDQTNVILGEVNNCILGRDHLFETIMGIEFKVGPASFLQVNTQQTDVLYKNLFRQLDIQPEETVLDLFCGAGTITLSAAKYAKKVYGIEIVEEAIENARFNARLNDIENVEFFAGDADTLTPEIIAQAGIVDTIIVDPPRKGLSEPLISMIAAAAPQKIGYVSCDPATLARDLALFTERGYRADFIQPVDMFPQTSHVECLTVLYRL